MSACGFPLDLMPVTLLVSWAVTVQPWEVIFFSHWWFGEPGPFPWGWEGPCFRVSVSQASGLPVLRPFPGQLVAKSLVHQNRCNKWAVPEAREAGIVRFRSTSHSLSSHRRPQGCPEVTVCPSSWWPWFLSHSSYRLHLLLHSTLVPASFQKVLFQMSSSTSLKLISAGEMRGRGGGCPLP